MGWLRLPSANTSAEHDLPRDHNTESFNALCVGGRGQYYARIYGNQTRYIIM